MAPDYWRTLDVSTPVYHMFIMIRSRALGLVSMIAALTAFGCASEPRVDAGSSSAAPPNSQQAQAAPMQPMTSRQGRQTAVPGAYKGPLPTIPDSPHAAAPPDVIRAVYEFAARRPDVLRFVPCFCGCERNGHEDNEDCFVASRDADGRPQWDSHGLT